MALADYIKCYVCGAKALYDGDDATEDRLQGEATLEVLCGDCAKTHVLVALPVATVTDLVQRLRASKETDFMALGALWQILRPATPKVFAAEVEP